MTDYRPRPAPAPYASVSANAGGPRARRAYPVVRRTGHGDGLAVSDVATPDANVATSATLRATAYDDVTIDPAALDEFAHRVLGRERFHVELRGWTPETPEAAAEWRDMAAYALPRLGRGLGDDVILGRPLRDLILGTFLRTFPTNIHEATIPLPSSLTAAVGRAIRYLEDHFTKPVRMADVVAVSRLSERGLQAAFQRELECTPTVYLRRIRLSAARRDLRLADATSTATVGEIARAVGFTHIGRFAVAYRDEFGESPRETLRR